MNKNPFPPSDSSCKKITASVSKIEEGKSGIHRVDHGGLLAPTGFKSGTGPRLFDLLYQNCMLMTSMATRKNIPRAHFDLWVIFDIFLQNWALFLLIVIFYPFIVISIKI